MKKNILYIMYSCVFVGICLIPSVLMPFISTDSTTEKRKLSEIPKIKTEDGRFNTGFFSEFETYFSEHFALRPQLVTADGYIKSGLFRTSPDDDVITGKDGWLYYGDTLNDFLNIETLSARGINNIKNNLEIINDYCNENNVKFVFTIAPNKNSVYPEYMPTRYVPADDTGNYERLSGTFGENFPFCDMKEVILSTESNIPLYHKEDTHWNNLGAYTGHKAIMNMLGKESCPEGNWTVRNDRKGDLAEMIYPTAKADDTQVYSDYEYNYDYSGRFRGLDDMSIKTSCDGKTGNLLMYRDSYGEAILPFMAECFGKAEFSRIVPYRLDNIGGENADTLIIEIVERNIPDLQKYAPVMPAPVVNSLDIKNLKVCQDITINQEESGNYIHIFGELGDEFFISDNVGIFVTINGITYRAFNAFEDQLLSRSGESSDNGFSLYVPVENSTNTKNITVISINENGTAVSSQ
ncbi:MAG: hypothetical protein K2G36_03870 [Ruminococcus sp.]|nr:hypothetical protein [Ruminococcus sp.]